MSVMAIEEPEVGSASGRSAVEAAIRFVAASRAGPAGSCSSTTAAPTACARDA